MPSEPQTPTTAPVTLPPATPTPTATLPAPAPKTPVSAADFFGPQSQVTVNPPTAQSESADQFFGTPTPAPAAPAAPSGFLPDLNADASQRAQTVASAIVKPVQAEEAGASPLTVAKDTGEAGLTTAGQVAGSINDFISEGVKAITPQPVLDVLSSAASKLGGTAPAQAIAQKWNDFASKHPEAAQDLGSVFNIGAVTVGGEGVGTAEEPLTQASGAIADTAKSLSDNAAAKAADTATDSKTAFVKNLVTPEMGTKDLTNAIRTGKVTEGAGLTGDRSVAGAVPNLDKITEAVKEVPGVSPKNTALENVNAIHDHIGTVATDLKTQLEGKQSFFSPNQFKGYMNGVKSDLAANPLIVGDAEKTSSKIVNKFSSLVDEKGYTPSGLLDARKSLDQWMTTQKGSGIFDPAKESAVSLALRSVRQGGNDFLSKLAPDVDVKGALAKQSALYDAIDNIAPKAAKEGSNTLQQLVKAHPLVGKVAKTAAIAATGAATYGAAKDLGVPLP